MMTEAQKAALIEEFSDQVQEIAAELDDGEMPLEDLVQEGFVGLIEGINKAADTDPDEWELSLDETLRSSIRTAIENALSEDRVLRKDDDLLVAQVELLNKSIDRLTEELGTKPNIDEIANDMKISQEQVLAILKLTGTTPDDETFIQSRQ